MTIDALRELAEKHRKIAESLEIVISLFAVQKKSAKFIIADLKKNKKSKFTVKQRKAIGKRMKNYWKNKKSESLSKKSSKKGNLS